MSIQNIKYNIVFFYALEHNRNLEVLDLSWNHLRGRGAEHIAIGMMVSEYLPFLLYVFIE